MLLLLCLALQEPDAEGWIRKLGDESGPVRQEALKTLRAMGEAALPALRKAEAHPDAEVRARVAELLHRIEWLPWIDPALLHRYPPLREAFLSGDHAGVLAWAGLHPSWAHGFATHFEAYAIRLLDHPDLELRKAATQALEAVPDRDDVLPRRPVAKLVELVSRWDPGTDRDAEQEWLGTLVALALRRVSALDRERLVPARAAHPEAARALVLLRAAAGDPSAVPPLIEIATSDDSWKSARALNLIHDLRLEAARPALLRKLREAKGPRRGSLRRALAAVADASCASELLAGLPPPGVEGRAGHLDQLALAGLREALPAFLQSASSSVHHEREAAFRGLARLGGPEAVDVLCDALAVQNPGTALPWQLGPRIGSSTVGKLFEMLECPNDACRWGGRQTLGFVTDAAAQETVVRRLLTERQPEIRRDLLEAVTFPDFLLAGGRGVESALEAIARNAEDPLAPLAAGRLLRMQGPAALGAVEAAAERLEKPPRELRLNLSLHPSDRLVDALVRWNDLDGLARAGTPAARAALERLAAGPRQDGDHPAAAFALFRMGVDASRLLGDDPYWSIDGALLRHEFPPLREFFRNQFRARGATEDLTWAASNWAHPEMIPALRKLIDEYDRGRRLPDPADEVPLGSGVLGPRWTARDAVDALAATGDRSLVPFFLARAEDFEYGLQASAVRALGRLRAAEALPLLRRLVRSGADSIRAEAIEALGRIGGPGTADFLREQLRDNPHAAPYALARLGVRCPSEVAALLGDRRAAGPIAGALDLMENPGAYANLDALLPPTATPWLQEFPEIVAKRTGVPSRFSPAARAIARSTEILRQTVGSVTLGEAFHDLECGETHSGGRFTHLFRDGAIEICTVEEASAYWRRRLDR